RAARRAAPGRALARARAARRRDAVRDAGADPQRRRDDPARRATRPEDGPVRGPDPRPRQRRAAADAEPCGCGGLGRAHAPPQPRVPIVSFLQAVIDGIALGAVYAVVAVGIGL